MKADVSNYSILFSSRSRTRLENLINLKEEYNLIINKL